MRRTLRDEPNAQKNEDPRSPLLGPSYLAAPVNRREKPYSLYGVLIGAYRDALE